MSNRFFCKQILPPKIHKGIAYYSNYHSARTTAIKEGGKVREFKLGFAVQYCPGGNYYPTYSKKE